MITGSLQTPYLGKKWGTADQKVGALPHHAFLELPACNRSGPLPPAAPRPCAASSTNSPPCAPWRRWRCWLPPHPDAQKTPPPFRVAAHRRLCATSPPARVAQQHIALLALQVCPAATSRRWSLAESVQGSCPLACHSGNVSACPAPAEGQPRDGTDSGMRHQPLHLRPSAPLPAQSPGSVGRSAASVDPAAATDGLAPRRPRYQREGFQLLPAFLAPQPVLPPHPFVQRDGLSCV